MKIGGWFILTAILVSCTSHSPQKSNTGDVTANAVWPPLPATTRVRFLYSFKGPEDIGYKAPISIRAKKLFTGPNNNDRMIRPYAIAANDQVIAIADPSLGAVHLYKTKPKTYRQLVTVGGRSLVSPVGVAISKDRIYIADSALNLVFILNEKQRLLSELSGFQRTTGLAFEPVSQRLYVTDTLAHQIRIYDKNGVQLDIVGERGEGAGQFNYPTHLFVTSKYLYVTDTMNFRIQIFSLEGDHINTIGSHGDALGYFAQPKGVGVVSDGHVLVVENVANRIQAFNFEGEFLMSIGGDDQSIFLSPTGIAIADDKIFVADSGNQQVQVFQYIGED